MLTFDLRNKLSEGDFIFRKGESIRELSFVVSGSLEVIQGGEGTLSVDMYIKK